MTLSSILVRYIKVRKASNVLWGIWPQNHRAYLLGTTEYFPYAHCPLLLWDCPLPLWDCPIPFGDGLVSVRRDYFFPSGVSVASLFATTGYNLNWYEFPYVLGTVPYVLGTVPYLLGKNYDCPISLWDCPIPLGDCPLPLRDNLLSVRTVNMMRVPQRGASYLVCLPCSIHTIHIICT